MDGGPFSYIHNKPDFRVNTKIDLTVHCTYLQVRFSRKRAKMKAQIHTKFFEELMA